MFACDERFSRIFLSEVFVNIVFLGGIFTEGESDRIIQKSKGGMQYAADTLQKHYLDGFCQSERVQTVSVINSPFIGAYPKRYSDIFFSPLESKVLLGRTTVSSVGYLNLVVVKNVHKWLSRSCEFCLSLGSIINRTLC